MRQRKMRKNKVKIKADIYEYLRGLLDSEQVIPIFMLSDNYYSSAACLNEMGAVWVKQKDYFTFLLPDFEFSKIKGAINPNKRGISLGYKTEREFQNLKGDLNQFRQELSDLLNLEQYQRWERKRDEFIAQIQKLILDVDKQKLEKDYVSKKVTTSSDWENHSIPLSEFGGGESE